MRKDIKSAIDEIPTRIPLSIHKTLKENLPASIDPLKDEIHITENGEIHISKEDGTLQQCNTGDIVKEISNPLTTQPLEYGYFTMSLDQTITQDVRDINFDVSSGNIPIKNGVVKLKGNKTYNISFGLVAEGKTSGGGTWCLYDVTNDKKLSQSLHLIPVTYTGDYSNMDSISCIVSPDEDCEVVVKRMNNIFDNKILKLSSHLIIQEIRNNPVNQYGGFETEVLFDGNANAVGEYTLLDDIDNYNFLFVTYEMQRDSNGESIVPVMTSNTEPAPYIASASKEGSSTRKAKNAFDGTIGNSENSWDTGAGSGFPQWLNISCGSGKTVSKFSLCNANGYAPKTFTFQGSNNGITYDDLLKVTDIPEMNPNEEVVFELGKPVEYSQYRWYFTEGYSNSRLILGEAKLFGIQREIKNTIIFIPEENKEQHITLYDKSIIVTYDKDCMRMSYENGLSIRKVEGVKGQLPTLLTGGTF